MYRERNVVVVVPAYNEAANVGTVVETMPEYVDRLFVVDDASTDGTWAEIRAAARADRDARPTDPATALLVTDGGAAADRIEVREAWGRTVAIRHDRQRGAGGAIKTGYLAALPSEADVVATMDGDGQMEPSQLARLLDALVDTSAVYAKGTRLRCDSHREAMPAFRLFGNTLLTYLTKLASGYWGVSDPQNGFTAISRQALEAVDVDELYEYYGYCNELLARLNVQGFEVTDVEIPAVYGDEGSHITYSRYVRRVGPMLLRVCCWRLYAKYLRQP